jgi:biopolymer transport protein ExbB/TolQ
MSQFFAGLETYLYVVSTGLFCPVMITLVFLTFWMVFCLGTLLRDYVDRKRGRSAAQENYQRALAAEVACEQAEGDGHLDIRLERLLQEAELRLLKSLDKVSFAVRVGPALGLMGTLIPMGIALSSLAQGNLPKMAQSMVTAFTTTVVGLACGVAAYLMSLVREKWVKEDMREMEYATERKLREVQGEAEKASLEVEHAFPQET